jgi:uncharacterized protein YuzE
MQVRYDTTTDLLYLRLDDTRQEVINRRVDEDIVLDIGKGGRIVGIEILDASKRVRMDRLLPVEYPVADEPATRLAVRENSRREYRTRRQGGSR